MKPALDYAPPPIPVTRPFWQTFLLRTAAFAVVAAAGWFAIVGIGLYAQPSQSRWTLPLIVFLFVGWVFTLVWVCRGSWGLGFVLGFVCGFSVAGFGGAFLGPVLGAIAGAAAMPLTKPPGWRRRT